MKILAILIGVMCVLTCGCIDRDQVANDYNITSDETPHVDNLQPPDLPVVDENPVVETIDPELDVTATP